MSINPGIRKTVEWLNALGWPTCDSGDGETHDHACDRDHAYVVIQLPQHRAARLVEECEAVAVALRKAGIVVEPVGATKCSLPSKSAFACIQASYDPGNGLAFIDVMHVRDEDFGGGS